MSDTNTFRKKTAPQFFAIRRNSFGKFSIFLLVFFSTGLQAQSPVDSLSLLDSLPVQALFATADNLGNTYFITNQNIVEKYAPGGVFLARYSNNRLGSADWIDVSNPLKILIWYADFRTVVFLNRSMTALGELNLIDAGYPEVRTVAAASDGNLWLFDDVASQIKKLSSEGRPLFESQRLNMIFTERINISRIHDSGQILLASDPNLGILQFDVYAQFKQVLPWKGITDFAIQQDQLAYLSPTGIHIEHLKAFASHTLALPACMAQKSLRCWIAQGLLFVQNKKVLEVWEW